MLETLDGEGDDMRTHLRLTKGSSVLVLCTEGATDPRANEEIVGSRPP